VRPNFDAFALRQVGGLAVGPDVERPMIAAREADARDVIPVTAPMLA